MYAKAEKLEKPNSLYMDIILRLRKQIQPEMLDNEDYHNILVDLILNGKSQACPENVLDIIANGQASNVVKKALYKEIYNSWKTINKSDSSPIASQWKSNLEILAWAYEVKSKNQKTATLDCCLDQLEIKKLAAFWEAIKFSEIQSLRGMVRFGRQSPEAWIISCNKMAESQLTSFTFSEAYCENVSLEMWRLFWRSIELSKIEHLNLDQVQKTSPEFWEIMCGMAKSNLKSLSLRGMGLSELSRAQWLKLYQVLPQIDVQSLDLSYNFFYGVVPHYYHADFQDNNSNSYDVICKIISLPSLKELTIEGDNFERILSDSWLSLCNAIAKSNLQHLKLTISSDGELKDSAWINFIDSLKSLRLVSLEVAYHSARELSSEILKAFCEMLENSSIETVSMKCTYGYLSLVPEDWQMLGSAVKMRNIKLFNFGKIELTDSNNLLSFFDGLLISGIDGLCLPGNLLIELSSDAWKKMSVLIKKANISLLDLRDNYLVYCQKWKAFCDMIVSSQIKTLYFNATDFQLVTDDNLSYFCDKIKNSQLETLELECNSNRVWQEMKLTHLKMLFDAINRSKISWLRLCLDEHEISKEKFAIVSNTLRIVENKAKCKNTLLGLCVSTLFGRYNAQLTEASVTYEDNGQKWEVDSSKVDMEVLRKFT
jgi:hypothetical protein